MPRNVLVHIGLPKTATTFLQKRLWCDSDRIKSIGKPRTGEAEIELGRYVHSADELCFRRDLNYLKDDLIPRCCCPQRLNVLSDELLSVGNLWRYGFSPPRSDRLQIAERLYSLFPEATILIVLRPQRSLLESLYLQFRRSPGPAKKFEEWLIQQREEASVGSIISALDFYRLAQLYSSLFGKERVKLISYTDFLHDQANFALALAGITGLDISWIRERLLGEVENKRAMGIELWAERVAHRYRWLAKVRGQLSGKSKVRLRSVLRALSGSEDLTLSPETMEWLTQRFSEANKRLEVEFGVALPLIDSRAANI